MMVKAKIHPLIILSLLFNAIAMGTFAYENYTENNIRYTVIFMILCLFFIVLTGFGFVRNSKINRTSK